MVKQFSDIGSYSSELTDKLSGIDTAELLLILSKFHPDSAFYVLDCNQKVLLWSKEVEQLIGVRADEILQNTAPQALQFTGDVDTVQDVLFAHSHDNQLTLKKSIKVIASRQQKKLAAFIVLTQESHRTPLIQEQGRVPKKNSFHGIISRAPTMRPVFQLIQNAAKTEATVLVRGESGSGKELVAKAIHDLSYRKKEPFLAINCAALSASLLESELFGHVRGAFTGAIRDHEGLFKMAHGGTLFLDEVAEIPLELQAKLLRVIQERNYMPVGARDSVAVDVRLVAATHRSLREEVKSGQFREDLMYRLRVVPIFIPPLRDRREDISILLWHFIRVHNEQGLRQIEKIEPQAMKNLLDYPWPGNVRELQNVVEYAFAVGRGVTLRASELPPEFREGSVGPQSIQIVDTLSPEQEVEAIRLALENNQGKINPAARELGMSRATFWRKRKQYGL